MDKTADRRQLLSNVSHEECMEETTQTEDVFPPVSNAMDNGTDFHLPGTDQAGRVPLTL